MSAVRSTHWHHATALPPYARIARGPVAGPAWRNEKGPALREFPLDGVPCAECGRPALAFIPAIGVKHKTGWCRTPTDVDSSLPPAISPPYPRVRAA